MGSPRPHRRLRRLLALAALAALAGSLVAAAGASADLLTPESGGSKNADEIDSLYKLILVIAVIVFVGVEGALFYSLFKYRARKGRVAAQIHGNTQLEIGWTVGAAAILIFLTVFTFLKLEGIKDPPATGERGLPELRADNNLYAATDQPGPPGGRALNIKVDGQQYLWRYQYPGRDAVFAYEEMVVPEDTTVTLDISADDVAHSWWIPALGGKQDALPGYINKTWFKAKRAGVTYKGQCAELCGRNHANMLARVRVLTADEYRAWYEQRKRDIEAAQQEGARQREEFERREGEQATQGTGGGEAQTGGAGGEAGESGGGS